MKNVLILSNTAISSSESNGRIHSYFLNEYKIESVHNFYLTGITDFANANYIFVSPKNALKTKLLFGLPKTHLEIQKSLKRSEIAKTSSNNKSKIPFYHWLRAFAFKNRSILKALIEYVKANKIDTVFLWGCNVPSVYYFASKIKEKCNIKLSIFTGEDYPLKTYNYINRKKSFFYYFLRKSLRKQAYFAYKNCDEHSYANEDLKALYEKEFNISNGKIDYFKSTLGELKNIPGNKDFIITYGGNLYLDRAISIVDIAEHLKDYKNVVIDIYGNASSEVLGLFKNYACIHYHGSVSYEKLIEFYSKSNLLLHVEGFSEYYLKDCKYAFSTKISDGLISGIPFFAYGSDQISGIKFLKKLNPDYVACSKDELSKLDSIIKNNSYKVDYKLINDLFGIKNNL